MDLSQMDDSPVLWIRLDPDFTLIRSVEIVQPDFQWQYQLRFTNIDIIKYYSCNIKVLLSSYLNLRLFFVVTVLLTFPLIAISTL